MVSIGTDGPESSCLAYKPTPPADGNVVRVCVVGSGWKFLSGISYYTCQIANALASRYDVSAILMRRLLPRRLYPGEARVGSDLTTARYRDEVACLDGVDYYLVPSILRALGFLWRQRPQVVLMQWWTGTVLHTYLLLGLAARALGARLVVEFHEGIDTGEARLPFVGAYVRSIGCLLLSITSGVVVHSEFDRDALLKSHALGGLPSVVVPHGPYDYLLGCHSTEESGPDDGIIDLLFFGTIRPYKGLEYLIRAFGSLTDDEVALFRLAVVGETWEGWTLPADLIAVSRHRDRISFVNRYVHDEAVAAHFRQADAVVLPYLRSSSSGPLHMAMSYGLPVIVSSVGGLSEAAASYEGVRFVRPGSVDELRAALLEMPSLVGRHYADVHSWSRSVELMGDLFERVHKTGGRRRIPFVTRRWSTRRAGPARGS